MTRQLVGLFLLSLAGFLIGPLNAGSSPPSAPEFFVFDIDAITLREDYAEEELDVHISLALFCGGQRFVFNHVPYSKQSGLSIPLQRGKEARFDPFGSIPYPRSILRNRIVNGTSCSTLAVVFRNTDSDRKAYLYLPLTDAIRGRPVHGEHSLSALSWSPSISEITVEYSIYPARNKVRNMTADENAHLGEIVSWLNENVDDREYIYVFNPAHLRVVPPPRIRDVIYSAAWQLPFPIFQMHSMPVILPPDRTLFLDMEICSQPFEGNSLSSKGSGFFVEEFEHTFSDTYFQIPTHFCNDIDDWYISLHVNTGGKGWIGTPIVGTSFAAHDYTPLGSKILFRGREELSIVLEEPFPVSGSDRKDETLAAVFELQARFLLLELTTY